MILEIEIRSIKIDIIWFQLQVGDNGAGKTTLLKILLGELNPVSGLRHAHRSLRIGYFSQHHVDQLEMDLNSVEVLAKLFPGMLCMCTVEIYYRNN